MTPMQIQLVRASFQLVEPIADKAAALFYTRLFTAQPQLRAMFRGDMHAQGAALMRMIAAAVRQLDRPDMLLPVLRSLGVRHAGYGVHAVHYDMVGDALLATLRDGLGDAFTPDVEDAWAAMYALASSTMQEAATLRAAA
jgi:hemoglobin-like flavoprotein